MLRVHIHIKMCRTVGIFNVCRCLTLFYHKVTKRKTLKVDISSNWTTDHPVTLYSPGPGLQLQEPTPILFIRDHNLLLNIL